MRGGGDRLSWDQHESVWRPSVAGQELVEVQQGAGNADPGGRVTVGRFADGEGAHDTDGLRDFWFGVQVARKGWLSAADVLNTRSGAQMESLFGL